MSILSKILVMLTLFCAGCSRDGEKKSPIPGTGDKSAKGEKDRAESTGKSGGQGYEPSVQMVDDPKAPIKFQITSKLGVTSKVEVKKAKGSELLNYSYEPEDYSIPRITLNQGAGQFFIFPARYVKSIVSKGETSVLMLADESKHVGKLITSVEVVPKINDSFDGWYDLGKAAEVTNLLPAPLKKPRASRPRFTLKVAEKNSDDKLVYPESRTFEVYAPKIAATKDMLLVRLGGEQLVAKFTDFDRVVLLKIQNALNVTVKAPGAQEKSGIWGFDVVGIQFETTNGNDVAIAFFGDSESDKFHGFILEQKSK